MHKSTVSQRISTMVEKFAAGNKSAFSKRVGISNQSLGEIVGGRQNAPSFAALQKILATFPEVRMEWLVSGDLPMLKRDDTQSPSWAKADLPTHRPKLPSGEDFYEGYIGNYPILPPKNNATIAVIDRRTIRNYFNRDSPRVLPKDLPKYEKEAYDSITVPHSYLKPGKHLAFVVDRVEMEPTIMRGDTVISRYVNPENWGNVDKDSICILLTSNKFTSSIIAARVDFNIDNKRVICCYDSKNWLSISMPFSDVYEVWEFEQKISGNQEDMGHRIQQEVNTKLQEVETIKQLKESIADLNRRVNRAIFREGIREILDKKLQNREDLYNLDYKVLADMEEVKALYTEEYGSIKEFDKYLSVVMSVASTVAFEISLHFKMPSDEATNGSL